jgi:uncharacterized protein (DUF433 family)
MALESGFSGVSVLDRPLYSYAEAARLLRVPSQTLKRWLEGTTIRGIEYPPVIRQQPTGSDSVTWGEFVEAGLLRGYRQKRVSLQRMRPFIERTRQEAGVPYPLAHFKPLILDRKELVYALQQETLLDPTLYLVLAEGGQMLLAPPVQDFLERVEFDPAGIVSRLHPFGLKNPVVIDPEVSFGVPQVKGIRTESVAESVAAGESPEEAALSWGLGMRDVKAALNWERSLQTAA